MKTTQELCTELNRWLAFRWQTAAHGCELPTETALVTYTEQILQQIKRSSVGTDALCRIYEERRQNGQLETNAVLDVLCAIDIKVTPDPDGAADKRMLRIVTLIDATSEATLAAMPLTLAAVEDAGKTVTAVKAVETLEADIILADMFVAANRVQDSVNPDVFERWLKQDERFREQHLICPACGGPARLDYEDGHLTCSVCDWFSHWEYAYNSDFVEESSFRSERDFLAKAKAFDEKQAAALAQINEGVAALEALYAAPLKRHDTRAELEPVCKSICLRLTKLRGKPIKID